MSNSLWPHGLQYSRFSYPSLSPRVCSDSYILSQWCHSTISSIYSLFPLAFNHSQHQGLFQWVISSYQVASIGASASALIFPMNTQGWFPLGRTDFISLMSKGLSRVFHSTRIQKHQFFGTHFFMIQPLYLYMTTGKTVTLTRWTFVSKVMSLLFIISAIISE